MKDRRVFKYSISLHPNVTGPQNHSYMNGKNYVDARLQKATLTKPLTPENKAANSKMATFIPPFFKNTETEKGKSTVLKDNRRTPSAFVPPFKKQRSFVQESSSKPLEEDKLHHLFVMPFNSNTYVPPTEKTQSTTAVSGNTKKEDIQTVALADTTNNKLMNNSDDNNEKLPVGCGPEDSTSEAPFVESRRQGAVTFFG